MSERPECSGASRTGDPHPVASARYAAQGMAMLWVLATLPLVHRLTPLEPLFLVEGPRVLGLTVGALIERALVWGAGPVLLWRAGLAPVTCGVAGLIVLGRLGAGVSVGPEALGAEAIGIVAVVLPSQFLLRWTLDGRHLAGRTAIHFVLTAGLLVGMIPAVLLDLTGSSPVDIGWTGSSWSDRLLVETLLVPLVLAMSALIEFVRHGRGTPMPADPPRRLVTTGPYAYVANPMQIAKVISPMLVALIIARPLVAGVGLFMLAWGRLVTYPAEEHALERRFGEAWRRYRHHVPRWFPRWRPWRDPDLPAARLYVDRACPTCSRLGRWFADVSGLEVCGIADYPGVTPRRLTYDPLDGNAPAHGVSAFARALEHRHFGWALWGWSMRLPGVRWAADWAVDMATGTTPPPVSPAGIRHHRETAAPRRVYLPSDSKLRIARSRNTRPTPTTTVGAHRLNPLAPASSSPMPSGRPPLAYVTVPRPGGTTTQ